MDCPYDQAQCEAPTCADPASPRYDPVCVNAPRRQPLLREDRMREVLDAFTSAATKFCAKVEAGDARSVVTYGEMKKALELRSSYGL